MAKKSSFDYHAGNRKHFAIIAITTRRKTPMKHGEFKRWLETKLKKNGYGRVTVYSVSNRRQALLLKRIRDADKEEAAEIALKN